jgi:N-acetylmuramoyl-L-alanine amidase
MRTEIANRAGAQLFLSVHFNSLYPDTKTRGTEVYVYTPPHQRSSGGLTIGKGDDSKPMQPVNRFDPWSSLFAHQLHRNVVSELGTPDRGQKTMHLAVLQDLNCPAALVESVFLSNETEARLAATTGYRQRIAESLAQAIRDYAAVVDAVRARANSSATSKHHRASHSS